MNDTTPAMTDLEALIQQAERQQKQMELELQFQKNMELFKKFAPQIYNRFIDHTPTELQLGYDKDGKLNLVNIDTSVPVYNRDPEEFIDHQLQTFNDNPKWLKIGFQKTQSNIFFQFPMVDHLIDRIKSVSRNTRGATDRPMGVLIINGCGLGYHISKLVEDNNISTLCIFDPHLDSFYACLHTIDWQPIIEEFYKPGRLIKLFINSTKENAMINLRLMTDKVGLHNICNTYVFNHLASERSIEFTKMLNEQFHLTLTGTGFFEDEQVGIAHTVANLNNNTPVLNDASPVPDLPPAFIVGNGPSLDDLLPFLREQGKNAIVFSCGSTTGTLFNAGITPDFHIEMERTADTQTLTEDTSTQEYRNNIIALALNTVTPKTLALYGKSLMAKKTNDAGEYLIDNELNTKLPCLNLCNPTCTNTGIAYATHLGFKEIYLLGVDLGMKDKGAHHAKSSPYYAENKPKALESESSLIPSLTVKGNFTESVKTTPVLDTSRANIELCIHNNPESKVYNLNDGAYIKGAKPTNFRDIAIKNLKENKSLSIDKIIDHNFFKTDIKEKITTKKVKNKYLQELFSIRKKINLVESPKKLDEIQQNFNEIIAEINSIKGTAPVSYWPITGSTQIFLTLIQNYCMAATNEEELQKYYLEGSAIFKEFLSKAYKLMRTDCLALHDINIEHSYEEK